MSTKPKADYLTVLELHELDEACRPIRMAFGETPYLVGSVTEERYFRDVDVRLILDDAEFDALFAERRELWALICRLGAGYLRQRTGLPVDFQIQRQTEANERYGGRPRNPLGSRSIENYAGGGDGTPRAT